MIFCYKVFMQGFCPQTNPMNSSTVKYLTITKSNYHPTNKKTHECGAGQELECEVFSHLRRIIFLVSTKSPT